MLCNWFYSKIVTVKPHRTEKTIGVVRVRDCLQTFIGDWHQLKQLQDENATVAVFLHGAIVRCVWNCLTDIEKRHLLVDSNESLPSAGTHRNETKIVTARVSALKIGRLISFGLVQTLANCNIVISMQQQESLNYLTSHPPILRHLLCDQCFIIAWHSTEQLAGVVEFDGTAFATNDSKVGQFFQNYNSNFGTLFGKEFGVDVKKVSITIMQRNATEYYCGQMEIFSATKSMMLSVGLSAALFDRYSIPGRKIVENLANGLYEWLSLATASETFDVNANFYNADNETLMSMLYNLNRQPNVHIFNDSQILDAMKILQTNCDDYCKRERCDGFLIQFYQVSSMVFCIPSLFFLLSQKK